MNISAKPTDEEILNIGLEKTTNFSAVPEFAEFKEGNYLVINTLSKDQITNLFGNLGNLLSEKLKDEMFVSNILLNNSLYQSAANAVEATKKQEIDAFNIQFTAYEGIRRGTEIKMLQNAIDSSNETNPEHIVVCSGVSLEGINTDKAYKVSTEKDSEGYVNKIIIEEN